VSSIQTPNRPSGDAEQGWLDRIRTSSRDSQRAVPPAIRAHPYAAIAVFTVCVMAFFVLGERSEATLNYGNQWLLYATVVVGFYYVFGVSGQFAFCQAAMMGVGAYTSALVAPDHGFVLGLLAALVVVAAVALVFALLVMRSGHFYFAIATLGLAQIVRVVLYQWTWFAGHGGFRLNIPAPEIFGFEFTSQYRMLWMSLGLLVVGLLLGTWIDRSPMKREAIAFRDRDLVASTLGVPIGRIRLQIFVVGSCYAAAAGAVFAHWQRILSPDSFGVDLGVGIFLMLVLGGASTVWGGVIGAAFYVFVPAELKSLNEYREVVYGLVLMIVIIRFPGGLATVRQVIDRIGARRRRREA